MDPKLSQLDPKLQDAYHRVMGTTPGGNPPTPQPPQPPDPAVAPTAPTAPDLATQPAPQQAVPPPPAEPAFTPPPAPPVQEVQSPPPPAAPDPIPTSLGVSTPSNLPPGSIPGVNSTMAFNADDSHKNVGTTPIKKGGLHIMPVVIGLGIIAALVAYTFVWIILFNVQVPFLPQL